MISGFSLNIPIYWPDKIANSNLSYTLFYFSVYKSFNFLLFSIRFVLVFFHVEFISELIASATG